MNPQLLITIYKVVTWIVEQVIQRRVESSPQAKAKKVQQRKSSAYFSVMQMVVFFFGALAASMFMCVDLVFAQDGKPITDDQVNVVAKQLFCPICENIPLDVCPTQACAQWRDTIREKLAMGWSEDRIKDYFVQQYGERVLAKPRTTGLSLYVWIIPPAAILIGALFFAWYVRNARMKTAAVVPASTEDEDDDYSKQLEKELAKRR